MTEEYRLILVNKKGNEICEVLKGTEQECSAEWKAQCANLGIKLNPDGDSFQMTKAITIYPTII